jgi:bifunctional non-homologous end joining protein LigD
METIESPSRFHVGDAPELARRTASKALMGWGRAEQILPDL